MYDIKLKDNEEIKLISDNSLIYNGKESKIFTSIITDKRFLILDYPSKLYNSSEDLRASGRISPIKMKEVISEINIEDIVNIQKEKDYYKIILKDKKYILISDNDIINYLKK